MVENSVKNTHPCHFEELIAFLTPQLNSLWQVEYRISINSYKNLIVF